MMVDDERIVIIGEDIVDPYGGAFKVTKGLSTRFASRVISTPISEQAITGAAIGMAMRGLRPIVEIMFGDFITLCADQIINHAAKYGWMYDNKVDVPLVIRTPMGAGRGYGPTHSQTLESMFLSVPNLSIQAPSVFHDPGDLLRTCVFEGDSPLLFIESKLAYSKPIMVQEREYSGHIISKKSFGRNDVVYLSMYPDEAPDVTLITYGGMADLAVNVSKDLFMEEEILVDVIVPSEIKPFSDEPYLDSIKNSGRVLLLEEGISSGGWGNYVSYTLSQKLFPYLKKPVVCLGTKDLCIPSSIFMEKQVLPSLESVKKEIMQLVL
jgi:pyruvate/2-oxoglutarate/acetoin dehydrogenase E1 component